MSSRLGFTTVFVNTHKIKIDSTCEILSEGEKTEKNPVTLSLEVKHTCR
jgi:hypothetical protein